MARSSKALKATPPVTVISTKETAFRPQDLFTPSSDGFMELLQVQATLNKRSPSSILSIKNQWKKIVKIKSNVSFFIKHAKIEKPRYISLAKNAGNRLIPCSTEVGGWISNCWCKILINGSVNKNQKKKKKKKSENGDYKKGAPGRLWIWRALEQGNEPFRQHFQLCLLLQSLPH